MSGLAGYRPSTYRRAFEPHALGVSPRAACVPSGAGASGAYLDGARAVVELPESLTTRQALAVCSVDLAYPSAAVSAKDYGRDLEMTRR